jgi:tRNA dimethylallyltransferase
LTPPPLITLLAGPTASGKSRLAMRMARETGALIVNADSQQLYADLRVLTARPSPQEEAEADHALYGVADAAEAWSVGRWSRAVLGTIKETGDRPVVLVGGTGLYFSALTRGLAEMPPVPDKVRAEVDREFHTLGEAAFRARLAEDDVTSAIAIEHGDRQRLVRAASVLRASGRALSHWRADTRPLLATDAWTGLVIEPERSALYAACDARVDAMLASGAAEEVEALLARRLDPALPAMKAVGVRELAAWIAGETTREAAVEALKQATRNYAKRQLTWFRNQTADWPRTGA